MIYSKVLPTPVTLGEISLYINTNQVLLGKTSILILTKPYWEKPLYQNSIDLIRHNLYIDATQTLLGRVFTENNQTSSGGVFISTSTRSDWVELLH